MTIVHPTVGTKAPIEALPPIERAPRDQPLKLSFAQQRLWFLAQLGSADRDAYNLPTGLMLHGKLDVGALRKALDVLVERHEILRTSIVTRNGEPRLHISPQRHQRFPLAQRDLSQTHDKYTCLEDLIAEEATASFDLERGPLIRGQLIWLAAHEHCLLITMHHIIGDGWSKIILFRELSDLYNNLAGGANPSSESPAITYADFAQWQHRHMVSSYFSAHDKFWRDTLKGAPTLLDLPSNHPRPTHRRYDGGIATCKFEDGLRFKLQNLSKRHGVSLFATMLASWAILMRRLSGQTDIVIGFASANRERDEQRQLIGFCVGNLPLRLDVSGNQAVSEFLVQVKQKSLIARHYQDMPFDRIVEVVHPERSNAYNPIYQVSFNWLTAPKSVPEFSRLTVLPLAGVSRKFMLLPDSSARNAMSSCAYAAAIFGHTTRDVPALFDLSPILWDDGETITGGVEFARSLFDRTTIERWIEHWNCLLNAMVEDDTQPIDTLTILSSRDRETVINRWNDTQLEFDEQLCIHDLFEAQAARVPDVIAVEDVSGRLSYSDLNRRANQLAHYLLTLGIGPDDRVAICVPRGLPMIVGMLAVLKAGGAYVPMDPTYPAERLAFMMTDSEPRVFLAQASTKDKAGPISANCTVLDLIGDEHLWAAQPASNPNQKSHGLKSNHLAYLIYTSGSTGLPKAVAIEHRNTVNLLAWAQRVFSNDDLSKTLFSTSISFDLSIFECFVPLSTGATVRMVENLLELSHSAKDVSLLNTVPSAMTGLLDSGNAQCSASIANFCGEPLKQILVDRLFAATDVQTIYNLYGPTETTTYSTVLKITRSDPSVPSVGRPIANTRIYILDAFGQPVPIGVAGELFIGGAGVARGYFKRPDLTAERFLKDSFSSTPGARMYKTGDLGRWRADGTIEFLGRNDFQVKLRGFRIELGEIEARLVEHPRVKESVVLAREDGPGEKQLVAYCVTAEPIEAAALREHLSALVPDYMVPSAFVFLAAMPLTPNGKLDRKALPAPEQTAYIARTFEPPRPGMEAHVASIWRELLHKDRIGRQDNFFDLGGHSLLAVQMFSRIRQILGVDLALNTLFAAPELAKFAAELANASRTTLPAITRIERKGPLPLSFAQQRLWFLVQLGDVAAEAYHQPMNFRLLGVLDVAALKSALHRIVVRHEALRTVFAVTDGTPEQRVVTEDESCFALLEHDLLGVADPHTALSRLMDDELRAPFDLERGPLIRGRLIREHERQFVLLITQHHILSDGWSMGVFVDELSTLYSAYADAKADPLPPLPVQYVDFAAWQRRWVSGEIWQRQAAYWKQTLAGAPELLELPSDRPRQLQQDYRGDRITFSWDAQLTRDVASLGQRHGTTMFMTLLTSWAILLARLTGQDDIVTGTPTANRGRKEIEDLIGFFVNSLAMRIDLSGNPTVAQLLARVKAQSLAALQNQDIPFEQVVELVRPARSLSHNPLFQVMFAWQNAPMGSLELPGLKSAVSPKAPHATSKFDFGVSLWQQGDNIEGGIEFATSLFDRSTIERWLGHWRIVLDAMCADAQQSVQRLPLLTTAERHAILHDWNDTQTDLPRQSGIHELFEQLVQQTPTATALVHDGRKLSYAELNARSNQLASLLRKQGVKVGDRILVLIERSAELIVALLATLKCGAAYVPVDPTFPEERQSFIGRDSGASLLLSKAHVVAPAYLDRCVRLDVELELLNAFSETNTALQCDGEMLACVMYTSGSTGLPKGVLVPQRAIKRLAVNNRYLDFTADDRVAFAANPAFDASTMEIWGPLLNGGSIVVIDRSVLLNPDRFANALRIHRVTVLWQAVGLFNQYVERLASSYANLRCLIVGGDALDPRTISQLLDGHAPRRLLNGYGPTETTTFALTHVIEKADAAALTIPIGRPIANTRVYILDTLGQPVPIGVKGEIHIGGEGVALGYLNRPELTAERFIADPFATGSPALLYRTGDLGCWHADGNIEFLGRNDNQVKIRGFRVELGEIEARIAEVPEIAEAIVLAREDQPGEKRLVAYATLRPDLPAAQQTSVDAAQVEQWHVLYQDLYAKSAAAAEQPDFIGWNSSYSQQPIPEDEMLEWQANTIDRIMSLHPRRVLEIGCGTGLLLLRLAPHCAEYVGTDFSEETVQRLATKLDVPGLNHVRLLQREAIDFSGIDIDSFDTVIVNSVAQYFPNADYLTNVIEQAMRALTADGHLFVGDVRNFDLIDAFHGSVQLARAHRTDELTAVRERARRAIVSDKELLISPDYFCAICATVPAIGSVQAMPKLGIFQNELTKYRFDAVLGRAASLASDDVVRLDWRATELSLAEFAERLRADSTSTLLVTNIRNPHVASDADQTRQLLREPFPDGAAVEDMASRTSPHKGWSPQLLHDLCNSLGHVVTLSCLACDSADSYHAFVQRTDSQQVVFPADLLRAVDPPRKISQLSNEPTRASIRSRLADTLRTSLQSRLPEYMIPVHFVFLDAMPLTANGKVDRKALPAPEATRNQLDYVAPRTNTEHTLARIWADALRLDRVGIYDDFFVLGGHSLLAVQVISRLRSALNVELSLTDLFAHPVLADLADVLTTAGTTTLPAIIAAERNVRIPLSHAQQRLWFLSQLGDAARDAYLMPMGFRLIGLLDGLALRAALNQLVARHESLRTTFACIDDEPEQRIEPAASSCFDLAQHDLEGMPDPSAALNGLLAAEATAPFDLERGPLVRGRLIRLSNREHVLMITQHHILSDGWSQGVLLDELSVLYAAAMEGKPNPLRPLDVQYADYALWQRKCDNDERMQQQVRYWREQLAGAPAVIELPTDRSRPPEQDFAGEFVEFVLDPVLTRSIHALGSRHGTTLFMTLLAGWAAFLSRMSGAKEVVVGTPTAGRSQPEIESLIGFFVNTLALRIDLSGEVSVRGLLARTKAVVLAALQHQDIPFEQVVEIAQPERSLAHNPLVQNMFALQNAPRGRLSASGIDIEPLRDIVRTKSILDLSVSVYEVGEILHCRAEFATALLDRSTVERWMDSWRYLLESMANDDRERVDRLRITTPAQLQSLHASNGADAEFRTDAGIHNLFEEQAALTPEALAVVCGEQSLSYFELNCRANRLAHHLREFGAGPDVRIALCLRRGSDMIVGLLAVLKAGAAYVPLDPEYPLERLAFMLRDSEPLLALTQTDLAALWQALATTASRDLPAVMIDASPSPWAARPSLNPHPTVVPANTLAYVIYTSGSTGIPKGVMVEHRALCNLYAAQVKQLGVARCSRVLQFASSSFDACIFEVMMALCSGASLHLARHGEVLAGNALEAFVEQNGITHAVLPPAVLSTLHGHASLSPIETLVVAGETLSESLASYWKSRLRLINAYGPTEASVCATMFECAQNANGRPPIGSPIGNVRIYILDTSGLRTPIGVMGEIHIGGAGVARGYLGRPELTAERFLPDPFSGGAMSRMYKTGDLGRWLADGTIEFLGRNDHQVKLRGFRVELGKSRRACLHIRRFGKPRCSLDMTAWAMPC